MLIEMKHIAEALKRHAGFGGITAFQGKVDKLLSNPKFKQKYRDRAEKIARGTVGNFIKRHE